MARKYIILLLLLPTLLAQGAGNGNGNGNSNGRGANRARGKTTGEYTLTLAGHYTGKGSASVSDKAIKMSGSIYLASGATATFNFPSLKITDDRFSGTGTVNGISCTIDGRVDLPDAKDQETNDDQALTGRIAATLRDNNGKVARLIGIQDAASRGGKGNGNGNGNGKP
jgi:hypothetical protein